MKPLLLSLLCLTTFSAMAEEHYFRFVVTDKTELDQITRLISIDNVRGDTVYAYANEAEYAGFRMLGYAIEPLPHPGGLYEHRMSDPSEGPMEWDTYPTYPAYVTMMRNFASAHPGICRLDTFGRSIQNRLLLALKISDNVESEEDEPEALYTSTMHGDETVGYVLLLRLADYLLTKYGEDTPEGQRVTGLVNGMEIWINPLANPDGSYWTSDSTVTGAHRGNRNGTDLNRDFPDRIADTVNTGAGREVETRAAMQFAAKHNFTVSANFHGGVRVVNYPWDNGAPSGTYSSCPDDAWFIQLSLAYSATNPDLLTGGFTNGITNGCQWYAIFGGRQDWIYWWHGGRETTIELWDTHNPPGAVLPQRWTNNRASFLAYLEEGLKGIRGIVTDAQTDQPLKASVIIQNLPTVPVFTDSGVGDYHRPVRAGTYTIVVRAEGYRPDTVRNIVVTTGPATRVDVALQPLGTGVDDPVAAAPQTAVLLQNYPNPFNPATTISYELPSTALVSLRVYNLLGQQIAVLADDVKTAGRYRVTFDAARHGSGVYLVQLRIGATIQTRKMLLLK